MILIKLNLATEHIKINLTPEQTRKANHIMFLSQITNYSIFLGINVFMQVFMKEKFYALSAEMASKAVSPFLLGLLMTILLSSIVSSIVLEVKFPFSNKAKYIYAISGVLWNICGIHATGILSTYAACFVIMTIITVYVDLKLTMFVNGTLGIYLIILSVKEMISNPNKFVVANMAMLTTFLIMIGSCLVTRLFITVFREQMQDIKTRNESQNKLIYSVADATTTVFEKYNSVMLGLGDITKQAENNRLSMHEIAYDMQTTAYDIQKQVQSTNEIQAKIQDTELSANKVENAVNEISEVIVNGLSNAKILTTQSKNVDDKTKEMSETLLQLSHRVKDVSGIVATILSISEETNLLALNASIEAARAGEAGRGFSVVADQIRVLSENTKAATIQITDIIQELEDTTKNTQNILNTSIESIHENNKKAIEVNDNFTDTGDNMKLFKTLVDNISKDIKGIYHSNKSIVDSITQLSKISDEVTTTAQTEVENNDSIIKNMDWLNQNMKDIYEEITNLKELIVDKE